MPWRERPDGDHRLCAECDAPVRSYLHRLDLPGPAGRRRCIVFRWCAACRVYSTALVAVPPERVPADALADLPAEERERLLRKEHLLVAHLARQDRQSR
ncbi:hypothetical protein ACFV1L_19930 [Kitasatospora sp. NPDC059646]|uniref:hypothetical protein n=1 Tax=Kitasatospora sp. NPDC059646 TaxID=3346893 RepID=UPI0036BCAC78